MFSKIVKRTDEQNNEYLRNRFGKYNWIYLQQNLIKKRRMRVILLKCSSQGNANWHDYIN